MKRVFVFALASVIAGLFFVMPIASQEEITKEEDSLDWDIDTIFDQLAQDISVSETKKEEKKPTPAPSPTISQMKRRGLTVEAAYRFLGGAIPGWNQTPWDFDEGKEYSTNPSINMKATFSMDAQISEVFRAKSVIYYTIPAATGSDFRFELGDFYFDYALYDAVFIRAGKFYLNWGISRNYSFTNLLSRIPPGPYRPVNPTSTAANPARINYNRDPYIFKADIPIGIGGLQLLSLTRINLFNPGNTPTTTGWTPRREDFAFGGKYNLAHRLFDVDTGIFYQEKMDTRGFVSIKTTLWDIEFYNEWLGAIDIEKWNNFNGAVNLGFARDFYIFNRRLTVGGEVFYNAENNAIWYSPETDLKGSDVYRFLEGYNLAFNLLYRIGGKGNPRLFVQTLYSVDQNSARLTPGFRLTPWPNIDVYLAVPMSLGSKDGYYYLHNEDPRNRPFSIAMLVTVRGSVKAQLN